MYVASTWAKQNLFVTYPMHMYNRMEGITLSKPFRFNSEISTDIAQGWLVEDDFKTVLMNWLFINKKAGFVWPAFFEIVLFAQKSSYSYQDRIVKPSAFRLVLIKFSTSKLYFTFIVPVNLKPIDCPATTTPPITSFVPVDSKVISVFL